MKYTLAFVLLALISSSFAALQSVEELHASISAVSVIPGEKLRAYQVEWFPDNAPRVVSFKGVEISKTDTQTTGSNIQLDAVAFVINTIAQATIAAGYFTASANVPPAGATNTSGVNDVQAAAFGFISRAFYVFEYVETNNQDGFQLGQDRITGNYSLSNIFTPWKPIQYANSTLTANGESFKVHTLTMQTLDEVFLFRFTVAERPVDIGGTVRINPNTIKIDFEIKWFNNALHVPSAWTTGPSNEPQARVGLVAGVAAAGAVAGARRLDPATSKPQFSFEAGSLAGFFTWESQADATLTGGGAVQAVRVTDTIVDSYGDPNIQVGFAGFRTVKVIFFGFDAIRPAVVTWDPEIGTSNAAASSATSAFVVNNALLFFSFAFLALFFKRN